MSSQMLGAVVLACAIWIVFAAALIGPRPFQPAGGQPEWLALAYDRPAEDRTTRVHLLRPISVTIGRE